MIREEKSPPPCGIRTHVFSLSMGCDLSLRYNHCPRLLRTWAFKNTSAQSSQNRRWRSACLILDTSPICAEIRTHSALFPKRNLQQGFAVGSVFHSRCVCGQSNCSVSVPLSDNSGSLSELPPTC